MDRRTADAYRHCRLLHRRHGRTYYLATRLLPAADRPHVHALYGFTRYADEIVDDTDRASAARRATRLRVFTDQFHAGLAGERVHHPVLPAVLHTIARYGLDTADFALFLDSMAMDLDVSGYRTYADLLAYMEGSAAVIGTMMLPLLHPHDPARARAPARELGLAFQLTNFIRDVAEDLQRGRVYLPTEDLARFGISRADLTTAARAGHAPPAVRELVRYEADRARAHYRAAAEGVALLAPRAQACVRTAYRLYGDILDEVARADHDVFARRAVVPRRRRLRVALAALAAPPGSPVAVPGQARAPASPAARSS